MTSIVYAEGFLEEPDNFPEIVARAVAAIEARNIEILYDDDDRAFVLFEHYAILLGEDDDGMMTMEYLGKQLLH